MSNTPQQFEYLLASDLSADELITGKLDGTVIDYRTDIHGRKLVKRTAQFPVIHGTPVPIGPQGIDVDGLIEGDDGSEDLRAKKGLRDSTLPSPISAPLPSQPRKPTTLRPNYSSFAKMQSRESERSAGAKTRRLLRADSMKIDHQTLVDELPRLAKDIAPAEMAARRHYFVDVLDLSMPFGRRTCLGWCYDGPYNADFADEIEGYRDNPGPVIALNGTAIVEDSIPGHFNRCVRSIFVHEVGGHAAANTRPTQIIALSSQEKIRQSVTAEVALDGPQAPAPFDEMHNAAFLRRCLHAWHRAYVAGWDLPLRGLAFRDFTLGTEDSYLPTIEAEAVEMAQEPYSTIDATPAPSGFTDLWQQNLEFYQKVFG